MNAVTPWFDLNALAWIGPGVGLLEGLWGGSIGLLSYFLVRRGRGRAVVFTHLYAGLLAGMALIGLGVFGALRGQPTPLWLILGALGVPLAAVAALCLVSIRLAYRDAELRRMRAMEL